MYTLTDYKPNNNNVFNTPYVSDEELEKLDFCRDDFDKPENAVIAAHHLGKLHNTGRIYRHPQNGRKFKIFENLAFDEESGKGHRYVFIDDLVYLFTRYYKEKRTYIDMP